MSDRQTYLRHPLEIAPLVFGLIFLGIVVAWGLFELDVVSGGDAAWILPIVLIASGALGIVLAATKDRRTRRRYENMYVTAPIGAPWPTATDVRLDDTATTEDTRSFEDAGATEDTRSFEDSATTEIRDPEEPADYPTDHATDPDHTDDTDDRNQPGATR
ncbi:MAG: hypothetical protein ACRDO0_01315 [Nocardioidaceae bacterium]